MKTRALTGLIAAGLGLLYLGRVAPEAGSSESGSAPQQDQTQLNPGTPSKPKLALSIKPQHVTDALKAVILSDREVYLQAANDYADKLKGAGHETAPLPAACELLQRGSRAVASKGVEYSYVLRAMQPLNKRDLPETDGERKGLQFVGTRPDLSYSEEELLGGRWYFTAVYPDVATSQSCIDCHNRQRATGTQNIKVGDVMGALVVRIALEL